MGKLVCPCYTSKQSSRLVRQPTVRAKECGVAPSLALRTRLRNRPMIVAFPPMPGTVGRVAVELRHVRKIHIEQPGGSDGGAV